MRRVTNQGARETADIGYGNWAWPSYSPTAPQNAGKNGAARTLLLGK